MAIRVAIIEDIQSIREGLEIILSESPGMECVGSYANAECALKSIRELNPDVVLVDMHMPGNKSAGTVQWLKPLIPECHFVVCAVRDDSEEEVEALRAGASGYVLKSKTPFNWVESIKHVVCGEAPMSRAVAKNVLNTMPQQNFTEEEINVLNGISLGNGKREIAEKLSMPLVALRHTIQGIYRKLHINHTAKLDTSFGKRA